MSQFEVNKKEWQQYSKTLYLKYKFEHIDPKIKLRLNLHENSHTNLMGVIQTYGKRFFKKKLWQVKMCAQVNVILLNANFPCYTTVL